MIFRLVAEMHLSMCPSGMVISGANLLRNAEFHLIKNAGHYLQEDANEALSSKINDFLARIGNVS